MLPAAGLGEHDDDAAILCANARRERRFACAKNCLKVVTTSGGFCAGRRGEVFRRWGRCEEGSNRTEFISLGEYCIIVLRTVCGYVVDAVCAAPGECRTLCACVRGGMEGWAGWVGILCVWTPELAGGRQCRSCVRNTTHGREGRGMSATHKDSFN